MSDPISENTETARPDDQPDGQAEDAKGPTIRVTKMKNIGGMTIVDVEVIRPE
jgi:hypothetical protein